MTNFDFYKNRKNITIKSTSIIILFVYLFFIYFYYIIHYDYLHSLEFSELSNAFLYWFKQIAIKSSQKIYRFDLLIIYNHS